MGAMEGRHTHARCRQECCGPKPAAPIGHSLAVAPVVAPPVVATPVTLALHAKAARHTVLAELAAHAIAIVTLEPLIAGHLSVTLELPITR